MFYAYSPSTGFDTARADALDGRARASLDEDENDQAPRRAVTLSELAAEKRGLGGPKSRAARRAFGDLSNSNASSRLTGAAHRSGGSTRSRATTAASDASTLRMDVSLTREEMDLVHARRRAAAAKPSQRGTFAHELSPRTPAVESPADSTATGRDTDDTVPPGALTIQRAARAAEQRTAANGDAPFAYSTGDFDRFHGTHYVLTHEPPLVRLLLWRETGRTAVVFCTGLCALIAARAPGIVAKNVPVNPVVLASYVAMIYLCRANLLCLVFPRRAHGFALSPDFVAAHAHRLAASLNALTDAHDDLLSGRDNKKVLQSFLALYGVKKLGARLNSTWWVFTTLWCVAFVAPAFVEWQHANVFKAKAVFEREITSRWRRARTDARYAAGVALAIATFWCADFEARAAMTFAGFVAARLWRETHLAQAARIDRAMRDASRRLSRAGSEFVEIMQTPSRFLAGTARRRR
jgi:hypothetical protein